MAAEVASPNGVFKRLDLDEKEDITSASGVDAAVSTPAPGPLPSEVADMEVTPAAPGVQGDEAIVLEDAVVEEVVVLPEAQYPAGELQTPDVAADGDLVLKDGEQPVEDPVGGGDENDAKGDHDTPGMPNQHSIYLAGVTRGADYEHAHDTVARAATAAAQGVKASSQRGPGRGRGSGDAGPPNSRGSDQRGPIFEKPTHYSAGGGRSGGRGRPDSGRGSDSRGPPSREAYSGSNNVPPALLPYYTRGADYEEAHDAVARAAAAATGGSGGRSGSSREPEPEYRGSESSKRWEQGGGQQPSWQEPQKPSGTWGEASKPYQQAPPSYQQPPPNQYPQGTGGYTAPPQPYQDPQSQQQPPPQQQQQQAPPPTNQGPPQQTYTEQQAYQPAGPSYDQQPQQRPPPHGYENYAGQGYTQQPYTQPVYTQPVQQGYGQEYAQQQYQQPPVQAYAPPGQDYAAQAAPGAPQTYAPQPAAPAPAAYAPAPTYQAYQ